MTAATSASDGYADPNPEGAKWKPATSSTHEAAAPDASAPRATRPHSTAAPTPTENGSAGTTKTPTGPSASSSSDRYAAATILLAAWDEAAQPDVLGRHNAGGFAMHENVRIREILRALVTPPTTEETVGDIANRMVNAYEWPHDEHRTFSATELADLLEHAILSGIQAAWESWESSEGDMSAERESIDRGFIENVTDTQLTVGQYARVLDAIPHSSIPEALGVIVEQVTGDPEHPECRYCGEGIERCPSPETREPDWIHVTGMWNCEDFEHFAELNA